MIVNNNTEALALYHSQSEGVHPDQTYISVGSIFRRVSGEVMDGVVSPIPEQSPMELVERSRALTVADRLANISYKSHTSQS